MDHNATGLPQDSRAATQGYGKNRRRENDCVTAHPGVFFGDTALRWPSILHLFRMTRELKEVKPHLTKNNQ